MILNCDNCGQPAPPVGWENPNIRDRLEPTQVNNGLMVVVPGGYGMFTDSYDVDSVEFVLCHDCSVRLFREWPMLVERFGARGHHPWRDGEEPCCEFGWAFEHGSDGEITGVVYGDGSRRDK